MAFFLPLAQTPPQLCGVLEDGSPPTQCKSLTPWSIGSRADLIDKILMLFSLSSLGAAWDTSKVSDLPNLELTQGRQLASITLKHCKVTNNPQPPGAKNFGWDATACPKAGKKSWEDFFFLFILRNQSLDKHPHIFVNLETQIFVQGRSDAQKRP